MAYHRSHSRSSSTGLASSISYLDGVPFKVGIKFKLPPRVFLPPELNETRSSEVLNDEYRFETEEAVLAWAKAREEAKEAQQRAKTENVGTAIETFSRTQDHSDSEDSSGDPEEFPTAESFGIHSSQSPQPNTVESASIQQKLESSKLWPRPVVATMSSDILMPVPIDPASRLESSKPDTQIIDLDLALFEQEDDPFDNMERQTINEMEELKTLLQSSSAVNVGSSNENADSVTSTPVALENGSKPVQQECNGLNGEITELNRNQNNSVIAHQEAPEDGDYVSLRMDYTKNQIAFQKPNADKSGDGDDHPVLGGQLPGHMATSKLFKPVLPPISPKPAVRGENGLISPFINTNTASNTQVPSNSFFSCSQQTVPSSVGFFKYSRHSDMLSSSVESVQHVGRPDSSGELRSAKSNPDILRLLESEHVPVGYPVSHSPPPRPSSQQMWNPYKPLPPAGTPVDRSSCSTPSSDSSSSDWMSPAEFDPYLKLSNEAQMFVNNLVSMGFPRPQVARAVLKSGCDEKEVIDHLCCVNKLVEKGFNAWLSESALHLFDNNEEKAQRYLELHAQFQELGFGSEKIKEALVKENMDRDKALDFLTA